ncbi:hypothetical protein GCM10010377_32170 [Streptomyces viridiviolaceus]|uniref:HAD family hydrolase n=1 Tax=Streptomyces viridiviolaceus TaxID=68282 RepID=A0ABW2ED88_9ACTN|nr:hypothetical protein [Streptomyces viridiviolaceus]GHB38958.1 hypothetical protein GCM10010377_32170 [Streptomyces viridiviolaceus]
MDWDGTVVDNGRRRFDALRQAFLPYGHKAEEDWYTARAGLPVVVTVESVERGKPAPDVYLEAARQTPPL